MDIYILLSKRDAINIRLFFLIGHLYLIVVWLGEDQRTNTTEAHIQKETRLRLLF